MGDAKPWQIILIVVAVVGVGFSVWRFGFGDRVVQSDHVTTMCVVTGEIYEIRLGKAKGLMLPAKHPETGERTLFPAEQQGGKWVVSPNFLGGAQPDQTPGSRVNLDGSVDGAGGEPKVFTLVP